MSDSKTLTAYVRLGARSDDSSRNISFVRPDDIPTGDLLAEGWALDGNQALRSVHPYRTDDPLDPNVSLSDALLDAERELVRFAGKHGYEVAFE